MNCYVITRAATPPELADDWTAPIWQQANTLEIAAFRPESSPHRPETRCRLLYDDRGIYGRFLVRDRYVVSKREHFQDQVCCDSCVEFFVKPPACRGYFNLEMNCSGVFLIQHVIDPRRENRGPLKEFRKFTRAEVAELKVFGSMPKKLPAEIAGPVEWQVGFFLPFSLFEAECGRRTPAAGEIWRANFYKCADDSSRPHWASWNPISELNFHLPDGFGNLQFQ
jgi:hypothetical protein